MGTKVEWLYYILQAFNAGDLVRYQELCQVHNAALRAQPALVENEKKLLEKINILCLMEIIFRHAGFAPLSAGYLPNILIFLYHFCANLVLLQPAIRRSDYSIEGYSRKDKTFYRGCGASTNEEPLCKYHL